MQLLTGLQVQTKGCVRAYAIGNICTLTVYLVHIISKADTDNVWILSQLLNKLTQQREEHVFINHNTTKLK